jgi:hypothetical protein
MRIMVPRSLPLAVVAGLLAAGCVIVPVRTEGYDAGCRVVTHHVELQAVQVAEIRQCANQGCAAVVLAGLGVTAVSGIVSGSIALIGNMAYWAERRANCLAP